MKIVLNKDYGGFSVSDYVRDTLDLEDNYSADRKDPRLIKLIEDFPDRCDGTFATLKIVEIPDEATDYYISDYDGLETIIYVINGKLYLK